MSTDLATMNALWDAINEYATACGGDPSKHVYGNTPRMDAVAKVDGVARALMAQSIPCISEREAIDRGGGCCWCEHDAVAAGKWPCVSCVLGDGCDPGPFYFVRIAAKGAER